MVVRYYSSVAPETTLTGTINSAATNITVGSTTGFPALFPYTLALDYEGLTEELVQVNSAAGLSLTVTRAVDGTSAASHTAGARVRHVSSARDFADSRTHENSDEQVHGLGPGEEIVGTEKVQTLENKTLESAAFTGSFTGTLRGSAAASSKVRIDNATDVSPSSTDHGFQIGVDASTNMRMDGNEVMVVNNGVAAQYFIQPDGGGTSVNSNLAADNTTTSFLINGAVDANQIVVSRVNAATAIAQNFKQDSDTTFRFTQRPNGDMNFGPGGVAAQDLAVGRSGIGTLLVSPNLNVANTILANNATFDTLTVNTTFNAPVAVLTGASVVAAQAGWSINTVQAAIRAGMVTLQVTMNRTGATIPGTASGDLVNQAVAQINMAVVAPNGAFGDIYGTWSNFAGLGSGRLSTGGMLNLQSWVPTQPINNGDTISCTYTYSQ